MREPSSVVEYEGTYPWPPPKSGRLVRMLRALERVLSH